MARYAAIILVAVALTFVWKRATRDSGADAIQASMAPRLADEELIELISAGEEIELSEHLADKGRYTIVEFTAEWCGACKSLSPRLEREIKRRGTVRLRVVDIEKWDSPVAYQFGIKKLPTLLLYDGDNLVSEDRREIMNFVARRD